MNEIDMLLNRIDELNSKIKNANERYDKIQFAYEIYRIVEAIIAVSNINSTIIDT